MHLSPRVARHLGCGLVMTSVLWLFFGAYLQPAPAADPLATESTCITFTGTNPFSGNGGPIGVAFGPGHLLVTRPFSGNPQQVHYINSACTITQTCTLPALSAGFTTGSFESYIDTRPDAPGFGAWNSAGHPPHTIFVTQGSKIIKQPWSAGSCPAPSIFTTIPDLATAPANNGIIFDRAGGFDTAGPSSGRKMIVTNFATHKIFLVDSSGSFTLYTTLPDTIEGPDVAPTGFGVFGGFLFVASETTGHIWAVPPPGSACPGGLPTSTSLGVTSCVVASVTAAEMVRFVPATPCHFGATMATFFDAIFDPFGPGAIKMLPETAFAGLFGNTHALVTTEAGAPGLGKFLLTASTGSSSVTVSPFAAPSGQHEGGAFCR